MTQVSASIRWISSVVLLMAAAACTARAGSEPVCKSRTVETGRKSMGCEVSMVSTNNRYPRGVGILPADVWGLWMSPSSSRSAMTLRIVAGDNSNIFESVREPTGWPSSM